jgi:hypothetical protein
MSEQRVPVSPAGIPELSLAGIEQGVQEFEDQHQSDLLRDGAG